MTHQAHPSVTREAVQLLAEHGFEGMARPMELLINECMKIERQQASVWGRTNVAKPGVARPTASSLGG